MKDFVDTFVSLISGVVVTSVTADLAVRVTLFTLLAGFAVTFLTETTVSLTVLGDADLAVLVAEERLRVAINVKKYRKKCEEVGLTVMGFTQESKFNLWESLTPEPPNLIGA